MHISATEMATDSACDSAVSCHYFDSDGHIAVTALSVVTAVTQV